MFTYSLVSTVMSEDRRQLRQGMRLLSEIAHKHGIPVTWAINAASARALAADLTQWHESHGDEPLLMVDIEPVWGTDIPFDDLHHSAEHIVTMRKKLPDFISSEWNKVQTAMAWASPVVAGAVQKNHVLLYALDQVGFKGLWGYRWEEIGGDRGCPFGFFYPSTDRHNLGGRPASRIAGIPRAALNTTQTRSGTKYHADATSQTDSAENDLADLQTQILNGTAQQTFDCYAANAPWNRWLAYIQQIDAAGLTELSSEYLEALDGYFAYVCHHAETQVLLLSDTVRDYQLGCNQTQPTFLLTRGDDMPHRSTSDDKPEAEPNAAKSTLFYYDAECQLTFEEDEMAPVDVKNYVSPPVESRDGMEFNLPEVEKFRPSRTRAELWMQFEVGSRKAMPYGLVIWGNHEGLTFAKSNARSVTWLGDRLLFVRSDLAAGKNEIEVVLTI